MQKMTFFRASRTCVVPPVATDLSAMVSPLPVLIILAVGTVFTIFSPFYMTVLIIDWMCIVFRVSKTLRVRVPSDFAVWDIIQIRDILSSCMGNRSWFSESMTHPECGF